MIGEDRRAYKGTGFFEQFFRILSNKDIYRTIYLPLSGDDEKTASWERSLIKQTCQKLIEYGCYSTILDFASYVLSRQNTYNKELFLEIMKEVKLDTFCVQYYDYHISEWNRIHQNIDKRFEDLRKFIRNNGSTDDSNKFSYDQWETIRTALVFTATQLYGLDMDADQVTEDDIEKLIKAIENDEMSKYKADLNVAIQHNREKAAYEKAIKEEGAEIHLGRDVCFIPTDYKLKKKTIGFLIEWMMLLFNSGKRTVAIQLLANHILVLLGDTIIEDKEIAGVFLNTIAQHLQISDPEGNSSAHLYDTVRDVIYRKTKDQNNVDDREYTKTEAEGLFNEYTGMTRDYLNAIERCSSEYGIISRLLGNLLLTHKDAIRENMHKELYGSLTYFTLVMLQVNGDEVLTDQFLVEMIDEISSEYRQRVIFQIILVTRILNSNNPKIINILNGYFNYEMDRPKRDLLEVKTIYVNMIRFIKDARSEIECRNEYTNRFAKSWLEVFFGDGIIDGFICEQERLIQDDQIEKVDGKRLYDYVEAFSQNGYIYVGLLRKMGHEISTEYVDDEDFGIAISESLYKRGGYYLEQYSKLKAFNLANILQHLHDNVNIVVQRRLYQLLKQSAKESLNRIQSIKNRATDDNEQEILEFLDDIVQDLTEQVMISSGGMSYIENNLDEAQEVFIQNYQLPLKGTLVDKLPLECRNKVREYLKTSQYIFDLLSTREFSEDVDYSAAIIPLTKALECILHQVYMQIRTDTSIRKEELDVDFHYAFWGKSNERTKENLELGSALYLIKGYKEYKIVGGVIKGNNPYENDFFTMLNVTRYLKIDRLKLFVGKAVPVLAVNSSKDRPPLRAEFTSDDDHNRTVLYTALDYIRDEFRNKCAHKDPIGKSKAEECRNIMIEAQQLLWILLWLYEPRMTDK